MSKQKNARKSRKLKWEKQYEQITKRFKIGKRKFNNFYKARKKARDKINKLRGNGTIIGGQNVSKSSYYPSLKDFEAAYKRYKKILSPSYRKEFNESKKSAILFNIENAIGKDSNFYNIIKKSSYREINTFFNKNPDLAFFRDASPKVVEMITFKLDVDDEVLTNLYNLTVKWKK